MEEVNILITKDNKGKDLVVIPHIIFEGKRSISWYEVEKYLLQYVGKIFEVSETKDFVYIDKIFADEYTGSVYTRKLRGALPKVKANMVQGIPEMIEIATEKRWKEDFEQKTGTQSPSSTRQGGVSTVCCYKLEEWNHDVDHVHVLFRGQPNSEISKFINAYKSASSRLIKKEYPKIRRSLWKEMFWSQSYCLMSTGGVTVDIIKQYIRSQGEK